jgi:hypothetical protein
MGALTGMAVGFVIGSASVLISGPAPGRTYFSTIGKSMIQSGGWFGCLMSVGSVLRAEETAPWMHYKNTRIYLTKTNRSDMFNK